MEYEVGLLTATVVIVVFFFIFIALLKAAARFIVFLLICAGIVGASLINLQAATHGRTLLEQNIWIYIALCVGISLIIAINSIPFLLLAQMHKQEKQMQQAASMHTPPSTQPQQDIYNDAIHSNAGEPANETS